MDNVSILSKSVLKDNLNPVKPDLFLNVMIALFVGFIASIGLAFY
ncbi:hypothetical protein F3K44_31545 [Bacillus megaterium]|nr:hypothetical protein [Priestia megaterium]